MTAQLTFSTVPWNTKFIYLIRDAYLLELGILWGRLALQIDRGPW